MRCDRRAGGNRRARPTAVPPLLALAFLALVFFALAAAPRAEAAPSAADGLMRDEPAAGSFGEGGPAGEGTDAAVPDGGLSERLTETQLRAIDTESVEAYWTRLMREYGGFFPDGRVPSFMEMVVPGGEGFDLGAALTGMLRFVLHEVLYSGKLIVTIVLLTVFCMILETMQSAFERNTVSKAAYAVAYMVLLVLAVNSFNTAIGYAKEAIGGMIQFMMAMIPLLLTLLA